MKALCRLLCTAAVAVLALAMPSTAYAQTNHTTNITLTSLQGTGGPVASALVCAQAVDQYGNPITFSETSWGLVQSGAKFCGTVVSGAVSGGINVPDACHANTPAALNYTFTLQALSSGTPTGQQITLPNVPSVCTSTWSLDAYTPTTSAPTPASSVFGVGSSVPSSCTAPSIFFATPNLYACSAGAYVQVGSVSSPTIGKTSGTAAAGNLALTNQGAYSSGGTYALNDVVQVGSTYYVSLQASNIGNPPASSPTYWSVIGGGSGGTSAITSLTGYRNYLGVNLFGDSTCVGNGSVNYATDSWCNQIGAAIGNATNNAVSGDQAADLSNHVYAALNPSPSGNLATVLESLVNDANHCGSSAGCQANATHAFLAAVSWAAIPTPSKILFGRLPSSVSTTGTWTQDSTLQTNLGLKTVVNASTVTFTTLVPSTSLYLTWVASDGDTATGALTCDSGVLTDTLAAHGFNSQTIATQNGATTTEFTNRYTFTANTTHTCTVTATASTGNAFELLWAGTAAPASLTDFGQSNVNAPAVYVSGVIHQQGGTNDTTTAAYDTIANTVSGYLSADGWLSQFVDARSAVSATVDMASTTTTLANGCVVPASTSPGLHPNGGLVTCNGQTVEMGGHANWAAAFLKVMLPTVTPPVKAPCLSQATRTTYSNDTFTLSDGTIFLGGGGNFAIPNPNGFPAGYCVQLVNFGGGTYTFTGSTSSLVGVPSTIGPTYKVYTLVNLAQTNWMLGPSTGTNLPAMSSTLRGGYTSLTVTQGDGALYEQAGTVTIPSPSTIGNNQVTAISNITGGPIALAGTSPCLNVPSEMPNYATVVVQFWSGNCSLIASQGMSWTGVATLASGTVTVSTAGAQTPAAGALYKLTNCGKNSSTAIGTLSVGTVTAGTSFVVNSLTATGTVATGDLSTVCWQIN